ncbi:YdiU family protein [Aquihabitans sp. G128]|uniref:protein adenylyltransferase SelO n=1 Tax=Aquihabitans sp. G128 TaxID=2849779 RepID=UPI001C246282|nr:YdiU family protein [Aquihabitans sp. G128]QXC62377.1 YdiU family protein [Aquihabitans sp. G128]
MSTTLPTEVRALDGLPFDNRFTRDLPADTEVSLRRRQVHGAAFSRQEPTPTAAPRTIAWSPEVAELLGLDPEVCASDDFAAVFAGSRVPAGADPFAACYGGHQFGNWAGQLGDGRAIALGEITTPRAGHQTLQLKGAGPTPYSRTADGRAVLRSSVREFLCSEAMHHLGVPTTRALSLVATGDLVVRDVLYDGNPKPEPGAVVCRVAPSFTRFGTFQLPASRDDVELLRELVAFTIRTDFPHLGDDGATPLADLVPTWFAEVGRRTAETVVHWMRVGFVHGVLNTDNLSILGLTIDYGPYGWLESFDPGWTPNTTDAGQRRYRYGTQPQVVHWNLLQLANALAHLVTDVEPLQRALDAYGEAYQVGFEAMMAERLGWGAWQDGDRELVDQLFEAMQATETDQVLFFRDLASVPVAADATDDDRLAALADAFYAPAELVGDVRATVATWLRAWAERVRTGGVTDDAERRRTMDAVNPRYVLRNYLAQEAIDAAEAGDESLVLELLDVLRTPYAEQPGRERFAAKRPEWARHRVGCSMLSCSS